MNPQLPQSRIEPVAEPVAQEVEAHYDEEDGDARHGTDPPGTREVLTPVGCHDAPCGCVWRDPYTEEAEGGFGEDE